MNLDFVVSPATPVNEVVKAIDRSGRISIALVVDESGKLLYTLTDGDIRRGILAGVPMSAPAERLFEIKRRTPHDKDNLAAVQPAFSAERYSAFESCGLVVV